MTLNEISGDIVDAAIKVHRKLGPGLWESVYELVLAVELRRRGHKVESQVPLSFEYEGVKIENAFRIDLLVDDRVVVELKSCEAMSTVHAKQLKTYLVLTDRRLGLLLNFGMAYMASGIKRILNGSVPDLKGEDLRNSVAPCEMANTISEIGNEGRA